MTLQQQHVTKRTECTLLKVTLSLHGADIGAVPGVDQLVCFSLAVHQGDLKQSLPFHQEYYEGGKGEGKEWGAIFTKNTETKPIW